ncbi:hypothetical protein D9M68_992920 [compost metagenome]
MVDSMSPRMAWVKLGSVVLLNATAAVVHSAGFCRSCRLWCGLPTTCPPCTRVPSLVYPLYGRPPAPSTGLTACANALTLIVSISRPAITRFQSAGL